MYNTEILKVKRIKIKEEVGASSEGHIRLCVAGSRDKI